MSNTDTEAEMTPMPLALAFLLWASATDVRAQSHPDMPIAGQTKPFSDALAPEKLASEIPPEENQIGERAPKTYTDPNTLEGCLTFWDRGTHMTRSEWKRSCQNSLDNDPAVN